MTDLDQLISANDQGRQESSRVAIVNGRSGGELRRDFGESAEEEVSVLVPTVRWTGARHGAVGPSSSGKSCTCSATTPRSLGSSMNSSTATSGSVCTWLRYAVTRRPSRLSTTSVY